MSNEENQPAQEVQAEDSEVWKSPRLTPTSFKAPTHFNSLQEQQHCFMGPQNHPLFLIRSEIMLPWNPRETVILLAMFKTSQFLSTGLYSPYWSTKTQENLFFIKALGHMPFICGFIMELHWYWLVGLTRKTKPVCSPFHAAFLQWTYFNLKL